MGPSPKAVDPLSGPETEVLWAQVIYLKGLVAALSAQVTTLMVTMASLEHASALLAPPTPPLGLASP